METAVSVAIIAASIAAVVVAIVVLVALVYVIRILAIVLTGTRRLDSALSSFTGDMRSALSMVMQLVPNALRGVMGKDRHKKKS